MLIKRPRTKWGILVARYIFITVGCILLAFGDAAFISPLGLVTGGVLSIGVIAQHLIYAAGSDFYVVDLVTWGIQLLLLGVSFAFLGKRFTLRSLYATLLFPAIFTLLSRVPMVQGQSLGNYIASFFQADPVDYGLVILAGLAGGALIGTGVAIAYHGGGSTGGLDVISAIIARRTPIKEGMSALIMDATLVIVGVIFTKNIVYGLIGVLSAFACALAVQYIYVNTATFVIADIISSKYKEIQKYVHETMDHATTLIEVTGGYTGEKKTILRVAFAKRELSSFRDFIGRTDPTAFVTFTQASMINGEGFDPLVNKHLFHKESRNDNGDLHG